MTHPRGPRTGRPPARAERGMVSAPHGLASGAGLAILRKGGSAVDAAIAANAVLCVVYPHMAGLGGDAFLLVSAPDGHVQALNASGPAAGRATSEFYSEAGEIPSRGPSAALTVPGVVDGWWQMHQRYGQLPWADLFADAIHYGHSGVAVPRSLAEWTAKDVPVLSKDPVAASIFLRHGRAPREGERLVNDDLAESLQLVADSGAREGFYEGKLAERLCAGVAERGSPLSPKDFAQFSAEWVSPISSSYRDVTVVEFPPNTQGFAALQILNILEGFDVASWPDSGVELLHHAAEAVKLAFADRDAWLTDPRHFDIPVKQLIDKSYAQERRERISSESALVMEEVSSGFGNDREERRSAEGDTCYLCAVDEGGLAVSLIQSIYHDFGAAVVPEKTGIVLQNRGSFFALDPDHPNTLVPGKRTFHTLIPAMLLRDGVPFSVLGTMGGEGQPQTHAALITRIVDRGYDVQQAIEAPRWLMGRTWGAESQDLWLEGRITDPVASELERLGQPVQMLPDWNDNVGHAQAILIHPDGFLEGGADPRGDGAALGF